MIAPLEGENVIATDNPARNSIEVSDVSGGRYTDSWSSSQVGNDEFRQALRESLELHTLLANGRGRYLLRAHLRNLDQPMIGLSMTVKADVHYLLIDVKTNKTLLDEVIRSEYKAAFGDALVGAKRAQLANEGAMKANIATIISKIVEFSRQKAVGASVNISVGG